MSRSSFFIVALFLILGCKAQRLSSPKLEPLKLSTDRLDFETGYVGHVVAKKFVLQNTNAFDVKTDLAIDAPFALEATRVTVPGGARTEISILFRPTSVGDFERVLKVENATVAVRGRAKEVPICESRDACQRSQFDVVAGLCVLRAEADGVSCVAQDLCIEHATCVAGRCIGSAQSCDDLDPCTLDSCGSAGCSHAPRVDCPTPQDPCQRAACLKGIGCGSTALDDGTACGPTDCVRAPYLHGRKMRDTREPS